MDIPQAVQYIVAAGNSAPSADNSQPWRFEWDGQALSLKYFNASQRDTLLDENAPATLMALGAVAENMISAANTLGEEVHWSFPFRSSDSNIYLHGQFGEQHKEVTASHWEHGLFNRHTNRFPYTKRKIDLPVVSKLEGLSVGAASIKAFCERGQKKEISNLVKRASAIRFRLREVHEWFAQSLRFTEEEVGGGDGLDVKTLPLPPGGCALLKFISPWRRMKWLNFFGLYKLFAQIEAQLITSAPVMVAVMSPLDRGALFDAGRLLEMTWCELSSAGLAVHPYYVLSDQLTRYREKTLPTDFEHLAAKLAQETKDLIGTDAPTVQMLLRVGYPSMNVVKSKRRKLDKVLIRTIST